MDKRFYSAKTLLIALSFLCVSSLQSDQESHTKYGLGVLTEEHLDHLENNIHKVIEVTPNDLGQERIQAHVEKHNLLIETTSPTVVKKGNFSTAKTSSTDALQLMGGSATLPRAVDNSKLPSFPPIGNQGSLGSCVAWGSTYYQASHELGLVNGTNNKESFKNVLSPKWTYNLINEGDNKGSNPLYAYQLLNINGAIDIVDFPYDNNYTAWDLNPKDWVTALSNRMAPYTLIPGLGGPNPQNLTAIKQALTNGHVLTFASFIDSWMYTRIKADPYSQNNSHAGEYAAYWMNGTNGGHFMTIVGYDDDVWIDINNNGVVDAGEKGAFLIANSWGDQWGNRGFIWVAYDAFLDHSLVPNAPNQPRVAIGSYLNSCLIAASPKAPHYSPSLIAQFSVTQTLRNEINIQAGISNIYETAPHFYLPIPAFSNRGGSFEFDGKSAEDPETVTFAIDLTDLIPKNSNSDLHRYYLSISDNTPGHPTVINSYSLIDLIHGHTVENFDLPRSYDNETGNLFIDYAMSPF